MKKREGPNRFKKKKKTNEKEVINGTTKIQRIMRDYYE